MTNWLHTGNPDKSEYFFAGLNDGGALIELSVNTKYQQFKLYIISNHPLHKNYIADHGFWHKTKDENK